MCQTIYIPSSITCFALTPYFNNNSCFANVETESHECYMISRSFAKELTESVCLTQNPLIFYTPVCCLLKWSRFANKLFFQLDISYFNCLDSFHLKLKYCYSLATIFNKSITIKHDYFSRQVLFNS